MGKRARKRARELATPPLTASAAPGAVHVTVAAVAHAATVDLRHETQLVKAALLYADHVTLVSPKALLMAGVAGFGTGKRRTRIDEMAQVIGMLDGGQNAEQLYGQLRARRRRLSPLERHMLIGLERTLDAGSEAIAAQIDKTLTDAGADEIAQAMSAGLVDIHSLGQEQADADSDMNDVIEQMATLLRDSVSASAQTFSLFDDGAGDLLRAMVNVGCFTRSRRQIAMIWPLTVRSTRVTVTVIPSTVVWNGRVRCSASIVNRPVICSSSL